MSKHVEDDLLARIRTETRPGMTRSSGKDPDGSSASIASINSYIKDINMERVLVPRIVRFE